MPRRLSTLLVVVLLLAAVVSLFFKGREPDKNSILFRNEIDMMPLDSLYKLYRNNINKNEPHDYSLAASLSRRGSAAAYFMLRRLAQNNDPDEVRGIVIALEEMKYKGTFDPCGPDRFYQQLLRTWRAMDPRDKFFNRPSMEALCPASEDR